MGKGPAPTAGVFPDGGPAGVGARDSLNTTFIGLGLGAGKSQNQAREMTSQFCDSSQGEFKHSEAGLAGTCKVFGGFRWRTSILHTHVPA